MTPGIEEALTGALEEANAEFLFTVTLCDNCLGRLFGKVGTGITNQARGNAIRERLKKHKIENMKECKWCRGMTTRYDSLAELAIDALEDWEFSTFLVGSKFDTEILAGEETLWVEAGVSEAESLKAEVNREVGKKIWELTSKVADFDRPDVVVIIDTMYDSVEVQVSPLYIYGRYNKHSREIPQTRWPCRKCQGKGCDKCSGTGKMYQTSVEQIIGKPALEVTGGKDHRFHGMGREDIDALMLGNGRPFVLEIKEPRKRAINLGELEMAINDSTDDVQVREMRPSDGGEVIRVKNARPQKTYRVEVALSEPVGEEKINEVVAFLGGNRIAQRTPIRVSHRRADKTRRRTVNEITVEIMSPTNLALTVTAEAGTYIKEFVHGDEGRTEPSIAGELGIECEVTTLDVVEILDENRGI